MAPQNETYEMLDTSTGGGGRGKLIAALIAALVVVGGASAYFLSDRESGDDAATANANANANANRQAAASLVTPGSNPGGPAPVQPTPSPAASPAASPSASPERADPARAGAGGEVVHFAVNGTQVLPADAARIEAFWAKVKDGAGGRVNVEGHADNTGPEAHNQWLSKARAEEVASLLRRRGADKKYQINVSGFSSSRPLADNDSEGGRSKNRRVEVSYAGGN